MIPTIIALFSVPLLLWSLTLFPWPDLPSQISTGMTTMIQMVYSFNEVLPIDTIFLLSSFAILIETALFGLRLAQKIVSLITTKNSISKQ